MSVKYLGQTLDVRTNTHVIYGQMTIRDYLEVIGKDFDEFKIQRRREKHRAYARMRQDIILGAQLPSITLALKPELVPTALEILRSSSEDKRRLEEFLSAPDQVNILDGLQRTYLMHDLQREGVEFKPEQKLLVEFWLEADLKNLIYRIIVLNAGQKPMSMRHQVELLFATIRGSFKQAVPGLEILVERDSERRERANQFQLDRLVMAYQSFLTKTPEVSRESIIAQKLIEDDVLDLDENQIGMIYDEFLKYFKFYSDLDVEVCRVYDGTPVDNGTEGLPTGVEWFGSESVMNSFFAALAEFGTTGERKERIMKALVALDTKVRNAAPGGDPLGLAAFQKITRSINPRRVNVGYATRKLLFAVFREFFRDDGAQELETLWPKWASEAA